LRIGIVGAEGFLGSALFEHAMSLGHETVPIYRDTHVDKEKAFDLVINANGNSKKYLAEQEPEVDFQANNMATFAILNRFVSSHTKFIHFSSGEVYGEILKTGCDEDRSLKDVVKSAYGSSKYVSELIVREYKRDAIIIRLSGLIGEKLSKGPIFDIITGQKLRLDLDSQMQFINTKTVSRIAFELSDSKQSGIFNCAGRNSLLLRDCAQILHRNATTFDNAPIFISNMEISKLEEFVFVPDTKDELIKFSESI